MPVDGEIPWERSDHTGAKHDIYRRYLERWFPILLTGKANRYPSATYVEGFCGPGIYKGGEPGSPIIAMRALLDKVGPGPLVRFLLVDDDKRCIQLLREQFRTVFPERPRPADSTPVNTIEGTCAEKVESNLTKMKAWGQPIIAIFDSWGNAPVPHRLLRRLGSNVSSEVIVTFGPQSFIRFVSTMDASVDEVFAGDRTWRQISAMTDAGLKKRHLLTCYRQSLKAAGFEYLLDFELVDRRGESLYLVFGTNHSRGVEKIKDSLWEVDLVHGVGFRDPRDKQQEPLFDFHDPQLGALGRLLLQQLAAASDEGMTVMALREFALYETVFRHQHVLEALKPLHQAGRIRTDTGNLVRLRSRVWLA